MSEPSSPRNDSTLLSPIVLISVLAFLAGLSAVGGLVAAILTAVSAGHADGPTPALMSVAFLLAGLVGSGLLWAAAWLVRRQHLPAASQDRPPDTLPKEYVPAAASAVPPPTAPPAGAPPEAEIWTRLLTELEEINVNLLLTEEERQAKRMDIEARKAAAVAARVEGAMEAGDLPLAEELLESYARQFPQSHHMDPLRDKLAGALADQAHREFERGDLAQAERTLQRLLEGFPQHPQSLALRDRLSWELVSAVERAIEQGDLAMADRRLKRLADRFASHADLGRLRERLAAGRSAVRQQDLERERRRIQELMSATAFDKAEAAAAELVARHGDLPEAQAMLDLVRREGAAFLADRRRRLVAEVQRHADSREWKEALGFARRVLENQPTPQEVVDLNLLMPTLEMNARIEEVRQLRDRIRDHIRQKRFAEALDAAQDVIARFPDTQAAAELSGQLLKLKELAATNGAAKA